jgi:hypothetical protein
VVGKEATVTLVIPVAGLAMLVVLAAIAKERKYEMTSAALMVLIGVLIGWLSGLFWMFG